MGCGASPARKGTPPANSSESSHAGTSGLILEPQSSLSREIHRREVFTQKFRIGSGGDHGRVVGGQAKRRKIYRQALLRRIAIERPPKFAVGGHSARNEDRGHIERPRRGQSPP